jgi:hypothetical protein
MTTMRTIYKVEVTNFNNEGEIVNRVQDLVYSSLKKALRHLKVMASVYGGSFNEEKDKKYSYTHYTDEQGCDHIFSIDTMLLL